MSGANTDVYWSSKEREIAMELDSQKKLHREDELELFLDGQLSLGDRREKRHAKTENI